MQLFDEIEARFEEGSGLGGSHRRRVGGDKPLLFDCAQRMVDRLDREGATFGKGNQVRHVVARLPRTDLHPVAAVVNHPSSESHAVFYLNPRDQGACPT